ncbi:hypothetical protein Dda_6981 [Drechslerella dactyloides]|uniref:Uncharacterized protein n=1 Tax=Drechslerella dactyloides TaxID=74499 RepID=A0AAD6NIP8_DREDA|nr:hypothetical protein Dda_6981 [Drechslerella dactyloides]
MTAFEPPILRIRKIQSPETSSDSPVTESNLGRALRDVNRITSVNSLILEAVSNAGTDATWMPPGRRGASDTSAADNNIFSNAGSKTLKIMPEYMVLQGPINKTSVMPGSIDCLITQYQNSSPTSLLAAVDQLSKGTQTIMHQIALIRAENTTLRSANELLSKRRQLKRQRIQHGGTLTIHQADRILDGNATDEVVEQPAPPKRQRTPQPEATSAHIRRCGNYR